MLGVKSIRCNFILWSLLLVHLAHGIPSLSSAALPSTKTMELSTWPRMKNYDIWGAKESSNKSTPGHGQEYFLPDYGNNTIGNGGSNGVDVGERNGKGT